ncbi:MULTISPECIES: hypothetical protein [Bacteria]
MLHAERRGCRTHALQLDERAQDVVRAGFAKAIASGEGSSGS